MIKVLDINEFLKNTEVLPFIDVRSEKEFEQGHIPAALNIPILKNENRIIIGTTYKQEGREAAVLKGFELVGPEFAGIITSVLELVPGKELLIYCWRGGMRSNIMAWILSMAGFKVKILKGGYKSFRNWSLNALTEEKKVLVLGGYTGTGKTEVLQQLKKIGEQVIDLEQLANHQGSAFGGLGKGKQPSNEQFENYIAVDWSKLSNAKWVWLENESRMIGNIKIPDVIFERMRVADVIEITTSIENRLERILKNYGTFPKEQLAEITSRLKKRLGDMRHREALKLLEEDNLKEWARMMLEYYDKFYLFGNEQRKQGQIKKISIDQINPLEDAQKIINFLNETSPIINQ